MGLLFACFGPCASVESSLAQFVHFLFFSSQKNEEKKNGKCGDLIGCQETEKRVFPKKYLVRSFFYITWKSQKEK